MASDATITGIVLASFLLLALSGKIAVDYALGIAMVALLVTGVLSPVEAFAGFANPAIFVIISFYVVSVALKESGALTIWVNRAFGKGNGIKRSTIRVMLPVAAVSSFVSNTPVVAMMIPQLQEWGRRNNIPVSKLMIPLSFASILGGMMTMIGTSTNILLSGLMEKAGVGSGLHLFSPALVGIPLVVLGVLYFVMIGHRILPVREDLAKSLEDAQKYAVAMRVVPSGPLDGMAIGEAGLRHLQHSFLSEVQSQGRIMPAVGPREILKGDDLLIFMGMPESVAELRQIPGLQPAETQVNKLDVPHTNRALIEAVLSPSSFMVGKKIRDTQFRTRLGGAILAVSRNGERIHQKVGSIELRAGDTLLIEAARGFVPRHRYSKDFLLLSRLDGANLPNLGMARIALGLLFTFVLAVIFDFVTLSGGALILAGAMVATGCITSEVAQRSIDMRVVMAIGASLSLGLALQKTGLADIGANALLAMGHGNIMLNLLLLYVATVLVTEMITNNAAAVLMFPLALSIEITLGVDPMPFVMIVFFAASCSFITPIGYQTNLMVQGPGGYSFIDYVKVGLPLTFIIGVAVINLVPMVWGF